MANPPLSLGLCSCSNFTLGGLMLDNRDPKNRVNNSKNLERDNNGSIVKQIQKLRHENHFHRVTFAYQ